MAKYLLTRKAVEDLADIWNYTVNEWSENQADKYYKMLIDAIKQIAKTPQIGKNYEMVTHDLNGFRVSKHIIFYRILNKNLIEVVRILHERIDLKYRIEE
ncbi:type II toxin-antitoxin system RelE/ParE family toxin [Marinigracilibium pacificum]|uniref:Toxin n=1 Tax=Marinigracilibium pacificum TaxID=2729599 RepID=A0A848IZC2_9BACT|nr:type II toxin-antitoxin system RelE/ParE family toxin [Marinigracilibium pacificum]NMM47640.1 type II toxin-antitoxin system RelE/ParE family toxin [Marinigracilibium pacificum]